MSNGFPAAAPAVLTGPGKNSIVQLVERRVVISGIGMVTPLGNDAAATWAGLKSGRSAIGPITTFDASALPCRIAGELRSFDARSFMSAKDAHRTDPFIHYALAAALMAMEDAALAVIPAAAPRTGVLIGSGRGGVRTNEQNLIAFLSRGHRAVSPFYTPMTLVNMASGVVAMRLGATGPCLDVSTACATGTHAIGEAMKIIERGDADVMIAGGSEAALSPLVLAGFCQARALSRRNSDPERASRPFDRDRDGFVLSEGAGVLVLETLEHAEQRGARIYAELAGYGMSADAHHYTLPDPEGRGAATAMELAIADAGLRPGDIGYINAHGTSTVTNDRIETRAIKTVFGEHARTLAVSSTKSMLGHMLGAAGAVEAAITALAIHEGTVPPTVNYEHPDPDCDLDYVPNAARTVPLRAALTNSLGFGGINAALVLVKRV